MPVPDTEKEAWEALYDTLYLKDPKKFKKMAKAINPELNVPEVEQEEETDKKIVPLKEEIEKLKQELKDSKKEALVEKRREELKEKKKYTDEDVAGIEKFILDKRASNYEDAEILYKASSKPAAPTSQKQNFAFELPKKKEDIDFWSNNSSVRDKAYQIWDEVKSGKLR